MAIIDNSFGLTGALKSILFSTQKIKNYEFYLLSQVNEFGDLHFNHIKKTIPLRYKELSRSLTSILYVPYLLINTIKVLRVLKKYNINILHINDLYNMLGVMVKIFNPNIKLVYHVRLLPNSYARKLYPIWSILIEKYADSIICVSETVAQNFSAKAEITYDAIPLPDYCEKPVSNSATIKFVYLANYTRGKGHDYALKAFKKVTIELPSAILNIFGDTFDKKKNIFYKEELIALANALKIEHLVNFNGFAVNAIEEITISDIALNFSESESFSMTTLEGLSCGTPTIATDCGGPSEIIEDGISGILVPVGDINEMSQQMIKLAKDSELRAQFSKNGIERVKSKFMIEDQTRKLSALYARLLNQPYGH